MFRPETPKGSDAVVVLVVEDDVELELLWRDSRKASRALVASVLEVEEVDSRLFPPFLGCLGAFFIKSVKAVLAAVRSPEFKALSKAERSGPLDDEDVPETLEAPLEESSESPPFFGGPFLKSVCSVAKAVLAAERSPEVRAVWRVSKSSPIFPPPFFDLVEVEFKRLERSLLDVTLEMVLMWIPDSDWM